MKRIYLLLVGIIAFLSTFVACTEEKEEFFSTNELREITATAKHFIPETGSRAFSMVNGNVEFAWADGDTIGIFPNTGAQAYFPILVGSETSNTASFTGGGWTLKNSATYAAYYPFIGDFYMKQTEIPVSYLGQKHVYNAENPMAHLSAYDYMVASASTPASGKVNFQFEHLGAFVQLQITMPADETLTSVTLSAEDEVFTISGVVDLTEETIAIKPTEKSKTLALEVEGVTTTEENNVATLYLMLAPVDMTGKTLKAIVKTQSGVTETITLTSKNFEAGKAYGVSGVMNTSGSYKDGVVNIREAGNMRSLLGSNYLSIDTLKVVGPINGDDIYYLRGMLGALDIDEIEWGTLNKLNLSEATIVEGGRAYYTLGNTECKTSNKVVGDNMFRHCANLEKIVLPDNATSVSRDAFYNCLQLDSVIIGNEVTAIGVQAFYSCQKLTSVTIGKKVSLVGSSAFYGCRSLETIILPEGVTLIGVDTFKNCSSLTSITIPNTVTSMGGAFRGCSSLTSITIPNSMTSIGDNTFTGCSSLTSITIPNTVTSIGMGVFQNCSSLTSITIPNTVTYIGSYAFHGCSSLESITIPISVTLIDDETFSDCSSLTSITIPNSITSIDMEAFRGCSSLESITIPISVASIGRSAFDGCSSLKTLYCYANNPPSLVDYTFSVIEGSTLYVPAGCKAAYENSDWKNCFTNILEMN